MDVRAQSITVAQGQRPAATPPAVSGPGSAPATSPTMARDSLVLSRQAQATTPQPESEVLVTAPTADLRAEGVLAQPPATATVDALPVPAAATPTQPVKPQVADAAPAIAPSPKPQPAPSPAPGKPADAPPAQPAATGIERPSVPAQPIEFTPLPEPLTVPAVLLTSKDLAAFVTNVDLVPPVVPDLTLETPDVTVTGAAPSSASAAPGTAAPGSTAQTASKTASNQAPATQHPSFNCPPPDPKDGAVPADVQQKYPELTHVLQGILKVRDADQACVQDHLTDLSLVPSVVYEKLRKANLREIEVSAETVPSMDFNQNLKGVHPRGWPEGKTWDSVAGLYNPSAQAVSAGNGQEGSVSLPLHELGHAIGGLLKYDNDPRLIEAHKRLYPKLDPYFQQDGPGGYAGRQELLAEGIAVYLKKGEQAAVAKYDQGFVDFLKNVVLA